jgi:predicted PilT family ATPase
MCKFIDRFYKITGIDPTEMDPDELLDKLDGTIESMCYMLDSGAKGFKNMESALGEKLTILDKLVSEIAYHSNAAKVTEENAFSELKTILDQAEEDSGKVRDLADQIEVTNKGVNALKLVSDDSFTRESVAKVMAEQLGGNWFKYMDVATRVLEPVEQAVPRVLR